MPPSAVGEPRRLRVRLVPTKRHPLPAAASLTTEATRYRDDLMDWLGVQREGFERITNSSAAAANSTGGEPGAKAAATPAPEPAADVEDVQRAGAADEAEGGAEVEAEPGPGKEEAQAHAEL